jgi:hypothetical protein
VVWFGDADGSRHLKKTTEVCNALPATAIKLCNARTQVWKVKELAIEALFKAILEPILIQHRSEIDHRTNRRCYGHGVVLDHVEAGQ